MCRNIHNSELGDMIRRLNESLRPCFNVRCRLAESGCLQLLVEEIRADTTTVLSAAELEPFSEDVSAASLSRAFSGIVMAAGLGMSVFTPVTAEECYIAAAE